jgi:hypothetical protein
LKVKEGDSVAKGALLYIDTDGTEITAKRAGVIKLDEKEKFLGLHYKVNSIQEYLIPLGYNLLVSDGQVITKGEPLTEGSVNLQQYYALRGFRCCSKIYY